MPEPTADVAAILTDLVRCPSVTPEAGAALDAAQAVLEPLGFECHRLVFDEGGTPVDNLFARRGTGAPHLCFAGHVDVVPPGDVSAWSAPPFGAAIRDGRMIGRGTEDMKGAVAAFLAATSAFLEGNAALTGSISFLITGDEEGPAINGTTKVLEWMEDQGHVPDFCLLGEPTNRDALGDTAKIGRRGSLTGHLTVAGRQGHVGYPALAANPVPVLVSLLDALNQPVDEGTDQFEPSNLEITTVDVGNPATNVIPARATASFNVRFNDRWSAKTLDAHLRTMLSRVKTRSGVVWTLTTESNAEAFLTEPGPFVDLIIEAVRETTDLVPTLSTNGGTSDARFITRVCPVIEFGLVGRSMHQVDEHVPLCELEQLAGVYRTVLKRVFSGPGN